MMLNLSDIQKEQQGANDRALSNTEQECDQKHKSAITSDSYVYDVELDDLRWHNTILAYLAHARAVKTDSLIKEKKKADNPARVIIKYLKLHTQCQKSPLWEDFVDARMISMNMNGANAVIWCLRRCMCVMDSPTLRPQRVIYTMKFIKSFATWQHRFDVDSNCLFPRTKYNFAVHL